MVYGVVQFGNCHKAHSGSESRYNQIIPQNLIERFRSTCQLTSIQVILVLGHVLDGIIQALITGPNAVLQRV